MAVKDVPEVKEMLSKADSILGYDLLNMCLTGPEEKLAETKYCQPAMFCGWLGWSLQVEISKPRMLRSVHGAWLACHWVSTQHFVLQEFLVLRMD